MTRRSRHRSLHLLEVGLRWLPESFLCWKLEGLAERGIRITVASRSVVDRDARLRGVELLEVPGRLRGPGTAARVLCRHGLALLLRSPRRLAKLWRGITRTPPATLRRYGGRTGLLAMCLPLARQRPDVVHIEWTTAATTYLALFDVWDCPVVVSCHGSDITARCEDPQMEHYAARLPEVLRKASLVHCVATALEREAIGLGLDPGKARVIRQGVDPERFSPANGRTREDGAFRVLAVGWIRWLKGYEYALLAIRELVDRGVPVRFELIGDDRTAESGHPPEYERILHTVEDLGLEERVNLPGALSSAEVARRLQRSHALVQPSLEEGLPTVLLEAMASGVPVVATDCGGVSEAFTDGVEGFLVPPRDPQALAQALERLWRDPSRRTRMGEAGRANATFRFTLERQLGEFAAMYREVAEA